MTSDRIAAVMVHVQQVEAAFDWYRQAFPDAVPAPVPDSDAASGLRLLRLGDLQIELVPADEKVASGACGTVVYWQVDDFDASLAHLLGLGASVYRGPMRIEDGRRMCQLRDPWGNCIGLRSATPSGATAGGAERADASDLAWTWRRFGALTVDDLHDALALRCRVFVLEQGPYLDPDGIDRQAWHLLGRDADGVLQAYLRAVDPGAKYAEPSIGRVVTAPESRGTGLGRALVAEGLARCAATWPGQGSRISAQQRLERFYNDLGYRTVGEPYLEDDIAHIEMWRPA